MHRFHTGFEHYSVRKKKFSVASAQKSRSIQERLRQIVIKRGNDNERIIGSILESFKQQGLIKHYYSTEHWSKKDRSGIDFVVRLWNGAEIGFDSKSSLRGVREYEIKRLKKGNNIWDIKTFPICVTSECYVNDAPLKGKIKEIIESEDPTSADMGLP
ncbi:MAG: hypothetical protein Q8N59_00240 [bacterium]|nr:hypothetical protein [bacterium]